MALHRGRVLSTPLFNTLMLSILDIPLPEGCKINFYADGLAIISTGRRNTNVVRKNQLYQDCMSEECQMVGLKISDGKLKVKAL